MNLALVYRVTPFFLQRHLYKRIPTFLNYTSGLRKRSRLKRNVLRFICWDYGLFRLP